MQTLVRLHRSPVANPERRVIVCPSPAGGWDWKVQYAAFGWIDEYAGRGRTRWGASRTARRVLSRVVRKCEVVV
jgi:hypothetical protein